MEPYAAAIGHVTADEYYQCLQNIVVGDKFFVRYRETLPGGMVANAACVLSSLGTSTYFFSALGEDKYTKSLIESFQPCHVNLDYIDVLQSHENFRAAILLHPNGVDRTIMLYSAEKPVLVLDDTKLEALKNAAFVYALISDLKTLPEYKSLLKELKASGVKFMFDAECSTFTSKDDPEDQFFFNLADILSFNDEAIIKYGGNEGENAVNHLVSGTDKVVLITRGDKGSTVVTDKTRFDTSCFPVKVADTTGAGDTFNAAFLHAYMKHWDLRYCARFATAAANRCVQYYGARSGAVPEEEILQYLREQN